MNTLAQALAFIAIAMAVFAVYGIFIGGIETDRAQKEKKKPASNPKEPEPIFKEQKILRLEGEIGALKSELEKVKIDYANLLKETETVKIKGPQLEEELTRREDWVKKSEELLNKAREENLDFKNKFMAKEKELQEEFTKNVNLNKEIKEVKLKNQTLAEEARKKTDQIEASRHQLERYSQEIKTHLETIAELKKKDEISEWVPKQEFHKLNEEYTELEKELEAKEQRIKILAEELVQLKSHLSKKEEPKAEQRKQEKEQAATEKPQEELKNSAVTPQEELKKPAATLPEEKEKAKTDVKQIEDKQLLKEAPQLEDKSKE